MSTRILLLMVVIAVASRIPVTAQGTAQRNPSLVIASTSGRDLFAFYCASCHGRDGKGGGPTAPALSVRPPDLTGISQRNGGIFPQREVEGRLTGVRLPTAHGSAEMPVWGPIFNGLDPDTRLNQIRIANVIRYLESIQTK